METRLTPNTMEVSNARCAGFLCILHFPPPHIHTHSFGSWAIYIKIPLSRMSQVPDECCISVTWEDTQYLKNVFLYYLYPRFSDLKAVIILHWITAMKYSLKGLWVPYTQNYLIHLSLKIWLKLQGTRI